MAAKISGSKPFGGRNAFRIALLPRWPCTSNYINSNSIASTADMCSSRYALRFSSGLSSSAGISRSVATQGSQRSAWHQKRSMEGPEPSSSASSGSEDAAATTAAGLRSKAVWEEPFALRSRCPSWGFFRLWLGQALRLTSSISSSDLYWPRLTSEQATSL